jgi:hypothetical protein
MVMSGAEENSGDLNRALEYSLGSRAAAETLGHTWLQSMTAFSLTELYTQLQRPLDALAWAQTASRELKSLGADPDSGDVGQVLAMSALAAGDYITAREGFADLLTDEKAGPDARVMARMGLAEIERLEGRVDQGLAALRALRDHPAAVRRSEEWGPWALITHATCLTAHVLEGRLDRTELPSLARNLADQALAIMHTNPDWVDIPVAGCALVGLGSWQIHQDPRLAAFLLALGERFNSRQDLPALSRDALWKVLADAAGGGPQAKARHDIGALTRSECLVKARDVLEVLAGASAP